MTPICSVKITSKPMILNPKLNLNFKVIFETFSFVVDWASFEK
jgi:NAD kinase